MKKSRKLLITTMLCITLLVGMMSAFNFQMGAATEDASENMRVAAGTAHALLIDNDGNVWSLGNNDYKQLGDGTSETRWKPLMVYHNSQLGKAVSVAAGLKQSMVLTEDGTVLLWGYNSAEISTQITANAVAISAGQEYCMAILKDGKAVTWSDKQNQRTVEDESGLALTNIKEISVGSNDTIILRDSINGTVYQLNTNDYRTAVPISINVPSTPTPTLAATPTDFPSSDTPSAISTVSSLSSADSLVPAAKKISDTLLDGAVSISAGGDFAAALLASGEVYTWGQSLHGVLGQGSIPDDYYVDAMKVPYLASVAKISAGHDHVIVAADSGGLFGWGNASQKRLDQDKIGFQESPVSLNVGVSGIIQYDCGNTFNLALDQAGDFYIWGDSKAPQKLSLVQTLKKAAAPVVTTDNVEDQSITVVWNTGDFYTGLASGFMVVYRLPNGTELKTQMLPVTTSQITLKGLQAVTNYTIKLQIHDKTGFVDETAPFIVKTLEDDNLTPTPEPTPTMTPEQESEVPTATGAASQPAESTGEDNGLSNLFGMLLIGLVFIVLIATVMSIIYVWRRIDRNEARGVKSVRIVPNADEEYDEQDVIGTYEDDDEDMVILDNAERDGSVAESHKEADGSALADEEASQTDNGLQNKDIDESGYRPEDEYSSGFSKRHRRDDDDDDDFIVRKPGEPKL
ncbi:MAG: hypothetical protein ACYC5K_00280 [Saccharofermentanales bacterium]